MKVTETWNDARASVSYFQGGKLVLNESSGNGMASRTDYVYDAAGQEVESFRQVDTNGDGVFDSSTRTLKSWDSGRVVSETQLSPDFDGDGLEGDYSSVTNYAYDAAGRLTWKGTVNYTYGATTGSDYRNEAWAYNADGTLASYAIDDPIMFDCVITRTNQYKYGNLMTIKEQNEIRYAHTADPLKFFTDESLPTIRMARSRPRQIGLTAANTDGSNGSIPRILVATAMSVRKSSSTLRATLTPSV